MDEEGRLLTPTVTVVPFSSGKNPLGREDTIYSDRVLERLLERFQGKGICRTTDSSGWVRRRDKGRGSESEPVVGQQRS